MWKILLQISIYYRTYDVMEFTERPEYSMDSFLSALGGALSLFLGVSLVQAFEVVEFLILFAWELIKNIWIQYEHLLCSLNARYKYISVMCDGPAGGMRQLKIELVVPYT